MLALGKYEITSELGHGASGRVFRAYDPLMHRDVAIKVLIADGDSDMLARFRVEAGAAGNLQHKNIVTIYEYNDEKGKPYIVMELLDGENLQQVVSRPVQLLLLDKIRILFQAAEGLAFAHEHGVIHRDIKPANIMLLRNGNVKLMDFGIARVMGHADTRRTRSGDLLGTILYMSPERVHGEDADACSDIFSFGVVCYEFIAGKHPFEGTDYGSVIYKITAVEPPPLRDVVPECPEALEYLVQRAIAKEREFRYQSMQEILFDLRPVLIELSEQRAGFLLEQVRSAMQSGEVTEVREKIRHVLDLDPANREARSVHEMLLKEQRRQVLRVRIDDHVQQGQVQLKERSFSQAVQCFESAWRLDSTDTQVKTLLEEAKSALEASRQASRMLSEARREMMAGNLTAAYSNAAGAIQADPQNRDAEALCEKLRRQIEERAEQMRVESALQRSGELLARCDFAGARAVLAEIEHEADPDTLADLRSRIDADEAEHLLRIREMRMQEGVSRARQQMQANQLTEAEETLRSLLEEFPDSTGAGKLLAAIQEHLEAQKRVEIVNNLAQQALGLIQAQQFLDACLVLGDGLQKYPNDFALQRLLDRAVALQRAHSRAKAIENVIEEAHEARAAERLDDALARVDSALAEHGHDAALMDLKRQIEFEQEQKQCASGVMNALAAGRELMDVRRFSNAVAALERFVLEYPGEPNLASLLDAARQAKTEQDEQQFVDDVTARFEELERSQKLQDAVDCIDEALKRYPYNTKLFALGNHAKESRRLQERSENIARRSATIEQAIAASDWTRVELGLRTAWQDFPGESVFGNLEEKFRQAQLQWELQTLASQVRQSIARDDLEGASRQLDLALGLSDHTLWQTLQQELEQQRRCRTSLQQARELEQRGDYEAAEDLLQQLLTENPADEKTGELLNMIREHHAATECERAISRDAHQNNMGIGDRSVAETRSDQKSLVVPDKAGAEGRHRTEILEGESLMKFLKRVLSR